MSDVSEYRIPRLTFSEPELSAALSLPEVHEGCELVDLGDVVEYSDALLSEALLELRRTRGNDAESGEARVDSAFTVLGDVKTLLDAYADGEISLHECLIGVDRSARDCGLVERVLISGYATGKALRVRPKALNRKWPPVPRVLRESAVDTVAASRFAYPNVPLGPGPGSILESVVDIYAQMSQRFAWKSAEFSQETLYKWYRADAKVRGLRLKAGRPRTRKT